MCSFFFVRMTFEDEARDYYDSHLEDRFKEGYHKGPRGEMMNHFVKQTVDDARERFVVRAQVKLMKSKQNRRTKATPERISLMLRKTPERKTISNALRWRYVKPKALPSASERVSN